MVTLLLIANIVNLGADLSAMGAALVLLTGGNAMVFTLLFGILCVVLEVTLSYPRYASVLKWTTLSLFAYVAVVAVAGVPWGRALTALVVPELQWNAAYATAVVAILGTTISPYLFFWQAGQEIEEEHRHHAKPLCLTPKEAGPELKRIRTDTLVGMAFSSIVSLAIVFATAATLNANGITDIETSAQAAEALRPIAGQFAFAMFALGIIGTGMLAVPILAGAALTSVAVDPVRALYWAAVVNGVLAAPLMAMMMLIVRNKRAMGRLTLSPGATALGWFATLVMAAATALFFVFTL